MRRESGFDGFGSLESIYEIATVDLLDSFNRFSDFSHGDLFGDLSDVSAGSGFSQAS